MVYNINIFKTEKRLLDFLKTDRESAWISGLGFVRQGYYMTLACPEPLPERIIAYVTGKNKRGCGSWQEVLINGQHCYMIYEKTKKGKKKCRTSTYH